MQREEELLVNESRNEKVNKNKQWVIVTVVLVLAVLVAGLLNYFKPQAEKKSVKESFPVVEYVLSNVQSISVPVISQGSIKAKTKIKLVAQVNGSVKKIAKLKFNGGFFKKGDLLLSIEDTDYRLAMSRATAQVAAAKQKLIRAQTEAGQAKYDLQQIGRDPSKSTSFALREPQLAEAKANFQAAQADLEISRLQMQRTQIAAPFDGRVVSKQIDIGQYVVAGTLLADIYSTEMATVRLPLSLQQTELLGLKLRNNQQLTDVIKIKLFSEYASKKYIWDAQFSHTEGEIDVRNRLAYLVAEVPLPYEKNAQYPNRPPLTPGMFVKAELKGVQRIVIKLPRSTLHYGSRVWVIDENNKLQIKPVKILSKDKNYIYIKSGINKGEKIITSAISYPLQGMHLLPKAVNGLSANKDNILNE